MLVLGISALDSTSCAVLLEGDRILAGMSEERLSRVKNQAGFPGRAVAKIFEMTGRSPADVDHVAYPFYPWYREARAITTAYTRNLPSLVNGDVSPRAKLYHQANFSRWVGNSIRFHRRYHDELLTALGKMGLAGKLERVEHHLAHHAAAFYCSPFRRALVVTLDWYGGGISGAIAIGDERGIERLHAFDYPHSLGLFYAQVTQALGFKVNRHEGKIVGLAAFGDPKVLHDRVRERFVVRDGDFHYKAAMDDGFARQLAREYPREHVAAAWQRVLEEVVQEVVGYYVNRYELENVVMAGGVAANVKMNQRVYEIPGVRGIYVHQAMGDDGTGTGAAIWVARKHGGLSPDFKLPDAYLGPEYSDRELEAACDRADVKYRRYEEIEPLLAKLIAGGRVIARFNGRMEYGPRALGNRSILYHCKDRSVNDWLNQRLQRTEFMPFAPACLYEEAERCFKNVAGAKFAAEFMTITFDGTDFFNETAPAASHVDGTARPQLVREDKNPSFYKVIKEYYKLTGLPNIINTSFNMHEEPIVCTPDDAIRAYKLGHLDYLAMGPYLAARDGDFGDGN